MRALLLLAFLVPPGRQDAKPPFRYVWGEATHILPKTTNQESGYFSLCEGKNGRLYVGTAKYGVNAYLVEVDPRSRSQRIVVDTHRVCGLDARGYAAQAKLHTRNFVGRSGRIYVGSKQGYREKGDASVYPGGYVIVYDPATDRARNLGMPLAGQGVIDVVADEARGRIFVVSCEDQHWRVGDLKTRTYRELGPRLTRYASTLVDSDGRAFAITQDFQLARFDPATGKVTVREILVDGKRWSQKDANAIPTWILAPDGRNAYLILMNDAGLLRIDLREPGRSKRLGSLIAGRNPDSRSALSLGPGGNVYAVIRVDNTTGFGKGYLHHLVRYVPDRGRVEDLGVLAVRNPDYYDFGAKRPWSHGFHRLPDGTLTPLHHHMALIMGRDGTAYVTILYPYTLLRIEKY